MIQELRTADNETTTSERLGLESIALDDSLSRGIQLRYLLKESCTF